MDEWLKQFGNMSKRDIAAYEAEDRRIQRRREMNKSNIQIEVCKVAPAVELREGRRVTVEMAANGHLEIGAERQGSGGGDRLILSRVECKTLAKVLASFAKRGDLGDFK